MYQPVLAPATGSGVLATAAGYSFHAGWLTVLGFTLMAVSLIAYAQSRLVFGEYLARKEKRAMMQAEASNQNRTILSTFARTFTFPIRVSIRMLGKRK